MRITEPRADLTDLAVHMSAFALEKEVEMVVLKHPDYSGQKRFGFRCDRITLGTPEASAACERQVTASWNLELIM